MGTGCLVWRGRGEARLLAEATRAPLGSLSAAPQSLRATWLAESLEAVSFSACHCCHLPGAKKLVTKITKCPREAEKQEHGGLS